MRKYRVEFNNKIIYDYLKNEPNKSKKILELIELDNKFKSCAMAQPIIEKEIENITISDSATITPKIIIKDMPTYQDNINIDYLISEMNSLITKNYQTTIINSFLSKITEINLSEKVYYKYVISVLKTNPLKLDILLTEKFEEAKLKLYNK